MFVACRICNGQNLVPNGDFETYDHCPTSINQLDSALFWFNPTQASPDYFNQCGVSTVRVPKNALGFQYANSGVAYGGIIVYDYYTLNYREYIEVPLTTGFLANNCYYFKMYMSLANRSKYSTDSIGIYFSDTLVDGIGIYNLLPFIPQLKKEIVNYTDTLNWNLIAGNYVAHGGESYLIIGNFKNDTSTTQVIVNTSNNTYYHAYFYIDDVSLTPCATGINEANKNISINITPNPFADKLNVTIKEKESMKITLYDITGRKLFNQSFSNSVSINSEYLEKGIYIYDVRNKNGVIKKGKLVKE